MKTITTIVLLLLPFTVFAHFSQPCPEWNKAAATANMQRLVQEIRYHDDLYFNQNSPVISDDEYDSLTRKLTFWTHCFPNIPVTKQPHKPHDKYTILHHSPMGSLRKASDEKDVHQFLDSLPNQQLLVQPKIDGIAVELIYKNGKLTSASTRGNGEYGMDILQHIEEIPAIPKEIRFPSQPLIVLHGELFIRLDKIPDAMLASFASARHFIAGLVNRKTPDSQQLQYADFFPWHWINSPYETASESITQLNRFGFSALQQNTFPVTTFEQIELLRQRYNNKKQPDFLMDGIVIKANDLKFRQDAGWSGDAPNWALAWKFTAKAATTQVKEIEFTIGRTGRITPVLILEPVEIQGKTIARISLGSLSTLQKKDIAVLDQMSLHLKGGAIPVFGKVLFRPEDREQPQYPDPEKYTPLTCLSYSPDCEQQFIARILWLAGKQGLYLPIDRSIIQKLIVAGNTQSLPDLLLVTSDQLQAVGMNHSDSTALIAAIKKPKGLEQQIRALGIPGLGRQKLSLLLTCITELEELLTFTESKTIQCATSGFRGHGLMKEYLEMEEVRRLIKFMNSR
ncbi:hypothetical protein [uncultured Endozoicomonas sp.]|uniref:hypothetical protein n=1 Tax=uncultured Endozoicomonas sp. TaxID=432652 RepID=UPI002618A062|nr:hypothetical protein [uncultured Endozoicomonas sp.]